MTQPDQSKADLDWRDGVLPVSRRFDDPYFSLGGGLDETRHVFLAGNDLPARLVAGFQVAELGFGTGLNLLALRLICPDDCPIRFTSFEAYPMSAEEIARALNAFPQAQAIAEPFLTAWAQGARSFPFGPIAVEVIEGDARESLPDWQGCADAWFLDGFSPAKNPELWSDDLMAQVGAHTAKGGTFATYTAAGFVRRALADAGFEVTRSPGFGHKRHMSKGVFHG
ncbi:tRNA (5-methylaminomethyl-2-thiouridine)(34)-methyltransferase MnmD [Thioclava sp.]|uniref:tRNA (5-methylaminomethyl-2-thiouridine)(34)-methyltransferase MnmD n=1 Tax=Thioclava sp. TaxID=1933450 RepID=UPI003AA831B6